MSSKSQSLTAASAVIAKPGYLTLKETSLGDAPSHALLADVLAWRWEGVFTSYGDVDGYVEPTTQELQRLYYASTDKTGDPSTIDPFIFKGLVYELVLETATDPRWSPLIKLAKAYVDDDNHPSNVKIYNNLLDASKGKSVEWNFIQDSIDLGFITKDNVEALPTNGVLVDPTKLPSDPLDDAIIELYIAYFNRAAEAEGIEYWRNNLDTRVKEGVSLEDAMDEIAQSFWPAASEAYSHLTGYTTTMSNFDFVAKIYANVLGRPDAVETDVEGIMYWVNDMETGTIPTQGQVVNAIIKGAYSYIDAHPDQLVSIRTGQFLENRIEVGRLFAQDEISGHLSGDAAMIGGFNAMSGLTYEQSSVDTAVSKILSGDFSTTVIETVGIASVEMAFM